jgi:hypothetical protein
MTQVVGISGKIGHGKDVIANYLVREHGYVIVRMSDALKQELVERLPRTLRVLGMLNGYDETLPIDALVRSIKPAGVRELLQEYGTEVRRGDDPEYWTKLWHKVARQHERVVVPDVRFENEAHYIRLFSGSQIWKVVRPNAPTPDSTHSSETFVDVYQGFDNVFINDGSIADLEQSVWVHLDEVVGPMRWDLPPDGVARDVPAGATPFAFKARESHDDILRTTDEVNAVRALRGRGGI